MRCLKPLSMGALTVPCGRCVACRLNKQREWALRITHEAKMYDSSSFVTLTYDDKKGGVHNTLIKRDCQLFLKRLRKNLGRKVRYFLSGEYGEKGGRPHYHLIIFGLDSDEKEVVVKSWPYGFVSVGNVSQASINYVAKYTLKKVSGPSAEVYKKEGKLPEFALMSRRPGIGWNFAKNSRSMFEHGFAILKGGKMGLPRFYKDKLFSEEDKDKLRLKNQRFSDDKLIEEGIKLGIKSKLELFKVRDNRRLEAVQAERNIKARLNLRRGKI